MVLLLYCIFVVSIFVGITVNWFFFNFSLYPVILTLKYWFYFRLYLVLEFLIKYYKCLATIEEIFYEDLEYFEKFDAYSWGTDNLAGLGIITSKGGILIDDLKYSYNNSIEFGLMFEKGKIIVDYSNVMDDFIAFIEGDIWWVYWYKFLILFIMLVSIFLFILLLKKCIQGILIVYNKVLLKLPLYRRYYSKKK